MRHRKQAAKLGRTTAHRKALIVQQLKSLIHYGSIETSVAKAKELRRHAERMITIAKEKTLASTRKVKAKLRLHFNQLSSKEKRAVKKGDLSSYNIDRKMFAKLDQLAQSFATRQGGYTRILRLRRRSGDDSALCLIEYIQDGSKSRGDQEAKQKVD